MWSFVYRFNPVIIIYTLYWSIVQNFNKHKIFSGAIKKSFMQDNVNITKSEFCKCQYFSQQSVVLSLPTVLVFIMTDPKAMPLPEKINFAKCLDYCYPVGSTEFVLKAFISCSGTDIVAVHKVKGQYLEMETNNIFDVKNITRSDYICLIYCKSLKVEDMQIQRRIQLDIYKRPSLKCVEAFTFTKRISVKMILGVKLNLHLCSDKISYIE